MLNLGTTYVLGLSSSLSDVGRRPNVDSNGLVYGPISRRGAFHVQIKVSDLARCSEKCDACSVRLHEYRSLAVFHS